MSLDYIARCPECHGIVAARAGDDVTQMDRKSTAAFCSGTVRSGLQLERMATEDIRSAKDWGHRDGCSLDPQPKRAKQTKLFGGEV